MEGLYFLTFDSHYPFFISPLKRFVFSLMLEARDSLLAIFDHFMLASAYQIRGEGLLRVQIGGVEKIMLMIFLICMSGIKMKIHIEMGWKAAYLRKPNRSDWKAHSHRPNLLKFQNSPRMELFQNLLLEVKARAQESREGNRSCISRAWDC